MSDYRGRLIFPMLAEIFRLDTVATEALTPPPDTHGGATGMDKEFRVPVLQESDPTDKVGTVGREEKVAIKVPVQVEQPGEFEQQNQSPAGNIPDSNLVLVFHIQDLEDLSLMGADGMPNIRVNSRLARIFDSKNPTRVIWTPTKLPGLYLTEIKPDSFGLDGLDRNLFISMWNDRAVGATS